MSQNGNECTMGFNDVAKSENVNKVRKPRPNKARADVEEKRRIDMKYKAAKKATTQDKVTNSDSPDKRAK